MTKTVNVSEIFTRDGVTKTQNFEKMGYASFVALQSALNGALSSVVSRGVTLLSALVEGKQTRSAGGDCDLRMSLLADHGAGTSEVVLGYTGISKLDADEIQALMQAAVASAA